MQIPVWHPSLHEAEVSAAVRALEIGYLGMGKDVFAFEADVARSFDWDPQLVVATHTGQSALHTILSSLQIQADDIIITPAHNNIADFQAILSVGAFAFFFVLNTIDGTIDVVKIKTQIN